HAAYQVSARSRSRAASERKRRLALIERKSVSASVGKSQMTTSQLLGFAGTGLVIGGYIPQIVHLVKERCTAGISISAFSLWCAASLLFLIHATIIGDAV